MYQQQMQQQPAAAGAGSAQSEYERFMQDLQRMHQ
jgi:hypothetical protein